jgi:PAS domain S-box-containing protein
MRLASARNSVFSLGLIQEKDCPFTHDEGKSMRFVDLSSIGKQSYYLRVLLVDDDEDDFVLIREMLSEAQDGQFVLEWLSSFQLAKDALKADPFDAVLMNYDLGAHTGIELIREAAANQYPAPILLLSGRGHPEADIEALQAGAADYLHKDELNTGFLERSIRYAIERRRLEKELERGLQERLDILASIRDGFFAIDREWRITYINARAAQNMGMTVDELLGKNILEAFPRLQHSVFEHNYRKVMDERAAMQFEMRGLYKNQWYNISVYPVRDGISIYWQDITERKQAEEALRLSEAHFNKAFNATPDALVISRQEDGRIQEINEAFLTLFGYSRAEVIGKTSTELGMFAHPADRETAVRRLQKEQSLRRFAIDIRTKSGEVRHARLAIEILTVENETLMLTIIHDETDQRQAEEAMRQMHEQAAWLARFPDENPSPVARIAADGKVLYCNSVAGHLPGWQLVVGQPVPAPLLAFIKQAVTRGAQVNQDMRLADRVYACTIVPFLSQQYVNLYGLDITGRMQTEAELRESEQRYSALFNAKTNGIAHCRVITDEQGQPVDYEILRVNAAYEQIIGIQRSEIEGRTARQVFPGIEHFAFDYIGSYGRVALEGGELNFETFFEPTRQWLAVYIYSPKPGEFTAIFTDISQSKQANG